MFKGEAFRSVFNGRPVERRYVVRLLSSLAVYGVVFETTKPFQTVHSDPAVRWTLALVLALSTLGAVWAIACYLVEEDDEYLRMRQVQAVLGSTALTLAVYTLWGYLTVFGLADPLPAHDIFPVFSLSWFVALLVRRALGR